MSAPILPCLQPREYSVRVTIHRHDERAQSKPVHTASPATTTTNMTNTRQVTAALVIVAHCDPGSPPISHNTFAITSRQGPVDNRTADNIGGTLNVSRKMAHINMEGEQIFALNGVNQIVRGGGKVTHILKVEVARHVSAETADRIQTAIYNHIANVAIKIIGNGKPITVTWTPAEAAYPTYYHCYSATFNDGGVLHHTQALLRQLVDRLDPDFNNGFTNGKLGVALLVSKPLGREVYIDSGGFILLGAKRKREEANT